MVTNQTVAELQEKSTIPLSCYLQIWSMVRSCFAISATESKLQDNLRWVSGLARAHTFLLWWTQILVRNLRVKVSARVLQDLFTLILSEGNMDHHNYIYIYKPLQKYDEKSQKLLSNSPGICNTIMSPSLKAKSQYFAENQKMWLQKNYSCQVMPVLCSDGILSFWVARYPKKKIYHP